MARPRLATSERIESYFADMPVSEQARMLERLELIHWLTKRRTEKQEPEGEDEPDVPVL